MTVKENNPRTETMRKRAKRKGWKRRDYYATPAEHEKLKACLDRMRK